MLEIKPRITTQPCNEATPEKNKKKVILKCEAEEASSYKWEKKDGVIPSNAQGVNSKILTLTDLSQNDAGEYRCEVTGDGERVYSECAKVIVGK